MTISASVLDAMLAAGCTAEQIVAAVKASLIERDSSRDARDMRKREAARLRQRRHREANPSRRDERDIAPAPIRVEDKSLTTEIEPQEVKKENKTPKGDLVDFQNELSDLDADRLQALIKHRRTKRAQNTGLAAKLFRRDAVACGLTMAQAVDMCISRNWITVKPDWLTPRQRGSPGRPLTGLAAVEANFKSELENEGYAGQKGPDPEVDEGLPLLAGTHH